MSRSLARMMTLDTLLSAAPQPQALSLLGEFKMQNPSNMAWSLAAVLLLDLASMDGTAGEVSVKITEVDSRSLGNIGRRLARLRVHGTLLLRALGSQACVLSLEPQSISNSVQTSAHLKRQNQISFEATGQLAATADFDAQGITNTLWGHATCNFRN